MTSVNSKLDIQARENQRVLLYVKYLSTSLYNTN